MEELLEDLTSFSTALALFQAKVTAAALLSCSSSNNGELCHPPTHPDLRPLLEELRGSLTSLRDLLIRTEARVRTKNEDEDEEVVVMEEEDPELPFIFPDESYDDKDTDHLSVPSPSPCLPPSPKRKVREEERRMRTSTSTSTMSPVVVLQRLEDVEELKRLVVRRSTNDEEGKRRIRRRGGKRKRFSPTTSSLVEETATEDVFKEETDSSDGEISEDGAGVDENDEDWILPFSPPPSESELDDESPEEAAAVNDSAERILQCPQPSCGEEIVGRKNWLSHCRTFHPTSCDEWFVSLDSEQVKKRKTAAAASYEKIGIITRDILQFQEDEGGRISCQEAPHSCVWTGNKWSSFTKHVKESHADILFLKHGIRVPLYLIPLKYRSSLPEALLKSYSPEEHEEDTRRRDAERKRTLKFKHKIPRRVSTPITPGTPGAIISLKDETMNKNWDFLQFQEGKKGGRILCKEAPDSCAWAGNKWTSFTKHVKESHAGILFKKYGIRVPLYLIPLKYRSSLPAALLSGYTQKDHEQDTRRREAEKARQRRLAVSDQASEVAKQQEEGKQSKWGFLPFDTNEEGRVICGAAASTGCTWTGRTRGKLILHMQQHHADFLLEQYGVRVPLPNIPVTLRSRLPEAITKGASPEELEADIRRRETQRKRLLRYAVKQAAIGWPCPTCGQNCRSRNALAIHSKVHSDERAFLCSTCGASFQTKGDLNRHAIIHTEEKPHSCDFCGKTFRWKLSVQRHRLTAHPEETGHVGLLCTICGAYLKHKDILKTHMKRVHEQQNHRPYQCPQCPKAFKAKTELNYHIRTHENPGGRQRGLNKDRIYVPKRVASNKQPQLTVYEEEG